MKLIPNYCQHPIYWDPRIHLLYVLDSRRVEAFASAISEVVRPGMVVADIGTGTGILARLAAEAGASRVYAIDRHSEILEFARRANEQLQLDDRIELIEGDALRVDLPEQVDVVVSELVGSVGNDEGIGKILTRAREEWLAEGGALIPSEIEAFFAPVDAASVRSDIHSAYDGDLLIPTDQKPPTLGAYYELLGLSSGRIMATAARLDSIDLLADAGSVAFETEADFRLSQSGELSGLVTWFRAKLSQNVTLDTCPDAPSTCWGQGFFPFEEQFEGAEGDVLSVRFSAEPFLETPRPYYKWEAILHRSDGGERKIQMLSNRPAVEMGETCLRRRLEG